MAPITLTKQQFLKKKPGGNYSKYLSYIANARKGPLLPQTGTPYHPPGDYVKPVVPKKPPKKVTLSPLDTLRKYYAGQILTPDELEAKAQELAGNQTTASQEFIRSESQRLKDEADRRRQLIMNAMLAAAGENAKMAPQVLGGYQQAATTLGGLAGAATGSVGDAMRADVAAQSAALANVGVAGPTLDTQQEGVENYQGGYLPASNLAAMGANANAGMLGQVAAQRMGSVEIPAKDYEATIATLNDQELSELAKIEETRPDLVNKILDSLNTNQGNIQKTLLGIEQEKRAIQVQKDKIATAQAELDYRYAKLLSEAKTKKDHDIAVAWQHKQQRKLDAAKAAVVERETAAMEEANQIKRDKLTWQEEHPDQTLGGGGKTPVTIDSIVNKETKSWKDRPQGNDPDKIADNIWIRTRHLIPKAKWPELRRRLRAWAKSLPIRQSTSGGLTG